MHHTQRHSSTSGQVILPLLGLLVILVIALTVAFDFGRFLLLRSRVRSIADTAALAGAGALDIQRSTAGNFALNTSWAQERAEQVYHETLARNPRDRWMQISLLEIAVEGRTVRVTLSGSCQPVWGTYVGIPAFSTRVTSAARAAIGITQEVAP